MKKLILLLLLIAATAQAQYTPPQSSFDVTSVPVNTGGWTEYFVTGSDFTTTSNSLVDITGMISGTLSASTVYEFQLCLRLLNAADVAGMKIGFHGTGTGSAATVFSVVNANSSSAPAASNACVSTIDTASGALVSYSAGEGIVFVTGFFTTRSASSPTFSVQILKVTSLTATVRVGSVFRIRKAHT